MFKRNDSSNFVKESTKSNSLINDKTLINYDNNNQTNYDNLNSLKVETQEENIDLSDLESDESSPKSDYSLPQSYSEMTELYADYNYNIEDERTDETETGTKDFSEENYEDERTDETEAKTKQIPEDNYEDERTDETETKTKDFSEENYEDERTDETEAKTKQIPEDNYETEDERTEETETETKDFSEDNYEDERTNKTETKTKDFSEDNYDKERIDETEAKMKDIQEDNYETEEEYWLDHPNFSKQNDDFDSIQNATNDIVAMLNDVIYSAQVSNSTKGSMFNDVEENTNSKKSVMNETDAFGSIQRTKSKGSMLKDTDIKSLQKTANVLVSTVSKQKDYTNIDTNDRQSMSNQNGDSDSIQKAIANERQSLLNETDYFGSIKKTSYDKEPMYKHIDDVDHVHRATNSTDSMFSDLVKPLQKTINGKHSMLDVGSLQRTPKNKESMFSETDLNNNSHDFVGRMEFESRKLVAHSTDSMSNDTNVETVKRASISNYKYSMFGKTDSNNNSNDFVERMGLQFEPRKLIVSVNDLKLQFQSLVDEWKTKLQTDQTNSTAAPGKTDSNYVKGLLYTSTT
jgi:hypothetical protein